ncbi:MAG: glycosyltransferase [Candidatus Azobacteroides sp.]|nr:glycosyltransferase [Candidatus Azobacteroides sp.]
MENIWNILQSYFDYNTIELAVISTFILFFVIQIIYYLGHYRKMLSYIKREKKGNIIYTTDYPSVSIIICSVDDSENLKKCLPSILEQDYPVFEVIIVNDSFTVECRSLIHTYSKKYPNLYSTYIPEDAKYLSRKKLSITIAAKAAKYDVLLFTEPDCYVESKHWIRNMMRNFTPDTGIVLGYSRFERKKGYLNRLASFDNLFSAMQYLGYAVNHRPYKGLGKNLAYRKELFFKNKGFAKYLYLQAGDDDLFVNQVATDSNTRIELSPESIPVSSVTRFDWKTRKMSNALTSGFYPKNVTYRLGFEVFSRYVYYVLFFGIMALSVLLLIHWFLAVVAGLLFIIRFCVQLFIINKTAEELKERKFYLSVIYFDLILPVVNSFYKLYQKFRGRKDYTYNYIN